MISTKDIDELIFLLHSKEDENKKMQGIIEYQKQHIQDLTKKIIELEHKIGSQKSVDHGNGVLLPLLEAHESSTPNEVNRDKNKSKFYRFLKDAFLNSTSKYYIAVNNILVVLIFFSVVCVIFESVPSLMTKWGRFFSLSEFIVILFFTVEYIINIYVADNKKKYIFGIWGIIDLLAIIPSYFHWIDLRDIKLARTLRIVRFFRTMRIMRILKLAHTSHDTYQMRTKGTRLHNTLILDLQIYFTALITVIIIMSTLVYYAEAGIQGTAFSSIPAAMWWCVVTITTVGYGDMHPVSIVGKIFASITMFMGLALYGILMNVIGKAMMTSLFGTAKLE
ncbi:MAG: ion transporter [bacterium]